MSSNGLVSSTQARRWRPLPRPGGRSCWLSPGRWVLVNYSRQPVQVRYQGPSTLDTAVPAGQSRTLILHAGDYQEIQRVSGPEWVAAPLTESRSFAVAKGEATIREWACLPAVGR